MRLPQNLDATNLKRLLPDMTAAQLNRSFSRDCGCSSACRARTQQASHGFCYYHETLYGELERRQEAPPRISLAAVSAKEDQGRHRCLSCRSEGVALVLIALPETGIHLCRPCLAELAALLPAGSPAPYQKKRSK